ncbi:MAG: MerR family transcriptional regulator [Bacteroidota bacterium]|nr:MerR family transcriptional regulator [Bacteroidota bacterium]
MNQFSISQLSQFSGIKAHTIRIWEQRYNALEPNRSKGNTRYYDNSQLRRLLNIVSLTECDYKISEIGSLPDQELFELIKELPDNSIVKKPIEYFVSQLLAAGVDYDEPHFEKIFSHCLLRFGMKETYMNVVYPMLVRIGLMWTSDTLAPALEHFISNIIRQKLFTTIDSLPFPKSTSDTWLLFLPENEFHEIGLLFAHYLVRLSGRKSIYLGSNVPLHSLTAVIENTLPKNLLLFLVHHDSPVITQEYLSELNNSFTGKNIYVAGNNNLMGQIKTSKRVHWLQSVKNLEEQFQDKNV